jgi:translation initiation factor IF-2
VSATPSSAPGPGKWPGTEQGARPSAREPAGLRRPCSKLRCTAPSLAPRPASRARCPDRGGGGGGGGAARAAAGGCGPPPWAGLSQNLPAPERGRERRRGPPGRRGERLVPGPPPAWAARGRRARRADPAATPALAARGDPRPAPGRGAPWSSFGPGPRRSRRQCCWVPRLRLQEGWGLCTSQWREFNLGLLPPLHPWLADMETGLRVLNDLAKVTLVDGSPEAGMHCHSFI